MAALNDAEIARWRLRSQHLTRPYAAGAAEVVAHLLAVQAENPSQSAWAVACRTDPAAPADLAGGLESGAVLRTHVLRPTWHNVCAEDVVWLIEVSAPRVRRVTQAQLTGPHGLDRRDVERASTAVLDSLADESGLTRTELAAALADRGVDAGGQLLMILLADLELQTLICSGPPANGEHTYALLSSRVPEPRRLERAEALAELARRYFSGHGPATERDLAYWATLGIADVRAGLAEVKDELASFVHDGRTFWHAPGDPPGPDSDPRGHLLQVLDEMYRGYQDSRWILDGSGVVPRGREAAIGMALVDGQLVAGMKRTLGASWVRFALTPFRDLLPDEVEALRQAAQRYGGFLGLDARLSGVPGAR